MGLDQEANVFFKTILGEIIQYARVNMKNDCTHFKPRRAHASEKKHLYINEMLGGAFLNKTAYARTYT
jgi:hypothetical protein